MRAVGKLGEIVWVPWDELRHAAGVIGTVLCLSVQPRYWAPTVWNLFARQVLAVGVEPLGFVCGVAAFVGMSVVVQLAFWTGKTGQSQLLGPLLVAVVARELGPLLADLKICPDLQGRPARAYYPVTAPLTLDHPTDGKRAAIFSAKRACGETRAVCGLSLLAVCRGSRERHGTEKSCCRVLAAFWQPRRGLNPAFSMLCLDYLP